MYIIGIIGSKSCVDKTKDLKEFIFKVKTTFGNTATIISGGNLEGIEKDAKKFALEFELPYIEYNPGFTGKNAFSALSDEYYTKKYHPTHFQHRYDCMMSQIDRLVIGRCDDAKDKKLYDYILKKAEKKGIKTMFI